MKIRLRLTLWYSGMLLVSLLLMSGVLYYELIYERRVEVPLEQRERAPEQMADILFFYGAPTLALLLIGGWFLMRRTLAPVTDLIEAVERVHADNLRERLPRSANRDELDRLAAVFNDMMARLEDSFARIREFTLHASHELKTPLTIMRGEIETFLRADASAEAQGETLAGHLDEIHRLTQIVDNLTLLAKAESGLLALAMEAVPLDELVREAYEDARILGASQKLEVILDNCEKTMMRGDRHRLRQLLLNLAENAAKYNQPGGQLRFSLRREGEFVIVAVANNGPGISPEQLPRVFDPFFRGDAAHEGRREGCGLGLSIARWIVDAHGGAIQILSEPDKFTTVIVRLPIPPSASHPAS